MVKNAKNNLEEALLELYCCEDHLNRAYIHSEDEKSQEIIHSAIVAVGASLNSAQKSLNFYKD